MKTSTQAVKNRKSQHPTSTQLKIPAPLEVQSFENCPVLLRIQSTITKYQHIGRTIVFALYQAHKRGAFLKVLFRPINIVEIERNTILVISWF